MIALKNQSTFNNFSLLYSKATPSFFNFFEEHIQLENIIPKSVIYTYFIHKFKG